MTGHPYRASDSPPPNFVCVSCYRTASVEAGTCSRCGAPRVPLESEQVRQDVRAYIERTQQRAVSRRLTGIFVAFTGVAIALYALLVVVGVVDAHQPHLFRHLPINDAVFFPLWLACLFGGGFLVDRFVRARRPRIDATTARVPEILEWLRVNVEASAPGPTA